MIEQNLYNGLFPYQLSRAIPDLNTHRHRQSPSIGGIAAEYGLNSRPVFARHDFFRHGMSKCDASFVFFM